MRKVFGATGLIGLLTLAASAHAMPFECQSGLGRQAYNDAYSSHYADLSAKWNFNYGRNCDSQSAFENAFGQPMSESGPPSRKCKNAGQNAAWYAISQQVSAECASSGFNDGAQDGWSYGAQFCVQFGHSRPTGDYGTNYEAACRAAYADYVQQNCPQKVFNWSSFYAQVNAKCRL